MKNEFLRAICLGCFAVAVFAVAMLLLVNKYTKGQEEVSDKIDAAYEVIQSSNETDTSVEHKSESEDERPEHFFAKPVEEVTHGLPITKDVIPEMADTEEGRQEQLASHPIATLFEMGFTADEIDAARAPKDWQSIEYPEQEIDPTAYDDNMNISEEEMEQYITQSKQGVFFLDNTMPYFYDADSFCEDNMHEWLTDEGVVESSMEYCSYDENNVNYWSWFNGGVDKVFWYDMSPYKIDEETFRTRYDKQYEGYVGTK